MKTTPILLMIAIVLLSGVKSLGQSVVWSGDGDGTSWSDAQNWVGQQVPGAANNVFITNIAGGAVTISSVVVVESIVCSNALVISSGSLTVTAGASVLQGSLTVTNGAALSANGSGTTLISGASVKIDNASLYALNGAVLSLPGAVEYTHSAGLNTVLQANGSGSALVLPGLTNLTGVNTGSFYSLLIQALAGGMINLDGLITSSNTIVQAEASGTGSELDMPALRVLSGYINEGEGYSELMAAGGGTVSVGQLGTVNFVDIFENPTGTLSLDALTNLAGSTLTVTNTVVALPNIVDVDDASFYVSGGGTLSLVGAVQYSHTDDFIKVFQASGSGSVLSLPGLTNVTGESYGSYYPLMIQAMAGGMINLDGLVESTNTIAQVSASGSGSQVDLSAFRAFYGYINEGEGFSQLQVGGGGTVLVGQLKTVTAVDISDDGASTLNLSSVTTLSGTTLSVTNGTVTLPNLVDIDNDSLFVNGGATLSLPGVLTYNHTADTISTFQASGMGSVLSLTGLTNVTGVSVGSYYPLMIQTLAGGMINLGGLIESSNAVVEVESSGSGSQVDLSALRLFSGFINEGEGFSQLEAASGGKVLVGRLGTVNAVDISENGSGALDLDAVTNMNGCSLTVTNEALTLTNLLDIDNTSLYVSGGATLALPNVVEYDHSDDFFATFQASGSGSALSLTGLTNVAGMSYGSYYPLMLQALAGGQLRMGGLISTSNTIVQAEAVGAGSELDLSALRQFYGYVNEGEGYSQLQAGGGGTLLAGRLGIASALDISEDGSGTLDISAVTNLGGSTLILSNAAVTFSNLANIDGANLYVSGGAVLSLPAVRNYIDVSDGATWQATNSGSVIALPGLTNLTGPGPFSGFTLLEALAGGQVLLDDLQSISSGSVNFLSDGPASTINLTGLSEFVLPNGQGNLTAQNGGAILFNSQPFLLCNVAVNIPAGNSVLPPTLPASQTLTLCASPWHSYRVEEQNMLQPGSPVVTILVPLTNSVEDIAAAPPLDTALSVTDFIANPSVLQIASTPDDTVQLVLFGLTNASYQIQSTTNLVVPISWMPGSVVSMTNAFYIFPETPAGAARQLFRAKQQ